MEDYAKVANMERDFNKVYIKEDDPMQDDIRIGINRMFKLLHPIYDECMKKPEWNEDEESFKRLQIGFKDIAADAWDFAPSPPEDAPAKIREDSQRDKPFDTTWIEAVAEALKRGNLTPTNIDRSSMLIGHAIQSLKLMMTAEDAHTRLEGAREGLVRVLEAQSFQPLLKRIKEPLFPIPDGIPTNAELIERRDTAVTTIFANLQLLRKILHAHGATIAKRWHQEKAKRRTALLKMAWEEIPVAHGEAFHALVANNPQSASQEAYKWPNLNLEDLISSNHLLLMLAARAENDPRDFVHADHKSWDAARMLGQVRAPHRTDLYLTFDEVNVDDWIGTYGKVTSVFSTPGAPIALITKLPIEGIVTLEIQAQIYVFLTQACLAIHKLKANKLSSLEAPAEPTDGRLVLIPKDLLEPPSKSRPGSESESLVDFMTKSCNQLTYGFGPPDMDNLRFLLDAQIMAAQQRQRAMRRNPVTFAAIIKLSLDELNRVSALIYQARGYPKQWIADHLETSLQPQNIIEAIHTDTQALVMLGPMRDKLRRIHQHLDDPNTETGTYSDIPTTVLADAASLVITLKNFLFGQIKLITESIIASKDLGLKDKLEAVNIEIDGGSYRHLRMKRHVKYTPLLHLLLSLNEITDSKHHRRWITKHIIGNLGIGEAVLELHRLLQDTPSILASNRFASEKLSDIVTCAQLCAHIEYIFPGRLWAIKGSSSSRTTAHMTQRTKCSLKKRRSAELHLKAFWDHVRELCKNTTPSLISQSPATMDTEGRLPRLVQELHHFEPELPSIPEWAPPKEPTKQSVKRQGAQEKARKRTAGAAAAKGKEPGTDTPMSDAPEFGRSLVTGKRSRDEVEEGRPTKRARVEQRVKEKTRGEADPSKDTKRRTRAGRLDEAPEEEEETVPPAVEIPVSRKSLQVIEALFPEKNVLAAHGRTKVTWTDYRRALHDIGFVHDRNDSGLNHFTAPDRWKHLGNITFHSMHNDRKVEDNQLRDWADELAKYPIEEELMQGLYTTNR
ncbi:hypothetical protein N7468_007568 [Penicillium chermesinum]|uniref:Uncharacterized protein n=1 Tax=Penicillium chermesinum TaxID=63820 RepID=A0A9W9NWP8_9EURO|nr:uncharacterized protein N7468_007568 [Penicillium chermesinum]KAJ5226343.1 hypothetical protein N7468_007568 [Penicillium chermesinum]